RGPGSRPRQLSARPGARRSRWTGASTSHRRQEPALRPHEDDRGTTPGEPGSPVYHNKAQKPGPKKWAHQGGKVVVAEAEQIKRLNAARLQLDIMRVPGIIVARTDAESATFIENRSDERDQPFILGATSVGLPSYKAGY